MTITNEVAEYTVTSASRMVPLAPPVTVAGMSVYGVGLQDWVYIATLLYIAIQIAYTVYKVVGKRRGRQ
jgi:hypothetical protein